MVLKFDQILLRSFLDFKYFSYYSTWNRIFFDSNFLENKTSLDFRRAETSVNEILEPFSKRVVDLKFPILKYKVLITFDQKDVDNFWQHI